MLVTAWEGDGGQVAFSAWALPGVCNRGWRTESKEGNREAPLGLEESKRKQGPARPRLELLGRLQLRGALERALERMGGDRSHPLQEGLLPFPVYKPLPSHVRVAL